MIQILCVIVVLQVASLGGAEFSFSNGFDRYVEEYEKIYSSMEEKQFRYSVWARNTDVIEKHNSEASRGLHSYTMGENQFTDMTSGEYRRSMLGFKADFERPRVYADNLPPLSALPDSVDWRSKGYTTEVGIQGQCGSCWAFTATGALEGQHKKKTGNLVDLSEQELMDCSSKEGNQGCEGGFMDAAFTYVKKNGGIDTEQSYPYNVTNPMTHKCKYTKANRGATCTGFIDLPKGNESLLQRAVADIGPISVAVDAEEVGFQMYKSGVYDDSKCKPDRVDHSLLITGYGVENGKEYYECKNSWGTSWGNQGYIRMVRNKNNQCGIASTASYPTV